jgi:hypothetical protein
MEDNKYYLTPSPFQNHHHSHCPSQPEAIPDAAMPGEDLGLVSVDACCPAPPKSLECSLHTSWLCQEETNVSASEWPMAKGQMQLLN